MEDGRLKKRFDVYQGRRNDWDDRFTDAMKELFSLLCSMARVPNKDDHRNYSVALPVLAKSIAKGVVKASTCRVNERYLNYFPSPTRISSSSTRILNTP
ncbi:MAG: hypothetical protein Ct9H300mP25_03430 [Acidobacteriota bacterium]|nr:MAG: hypothetical protein Ct9H300mP25_03430 [Acidobacteriota bacterium]